MAEKVNATDFADIEFTDVPDTSAPAGDTLTCEVCGKGIDHMYSGKGRKPKYCEEHRKSSKASSLGSGGARASADVTAAVNTLGMAYTALQTVLMMTGAHQAAITLGQSIPGLQEQNKQFLTQDKDLAKRINSMGKTSGRYGFFAAQALVLGPVTVLAAKEYREKFATPVEGEDASQAEDVPATVGGFPVV